VLALFDSEFVGEIAKLRRAGMLRYAWHASRLRDAGPSASLHMSPFGTKAKSQNVRFCAAVGVIADVT
jgi:hypothetical protein